uniref:HTH_48 domain-containing protein n=1 Tax=Strongyloides papillosus TaxID=174720 RepID=A0A0N5BKM7_STREA
MLNCAKKKNLLIPWASVMGFAIRSMIIMILFLDTAWFLFDWAMQILTRAVQEYVGNRFDNNKDIYHLVEQIEDYHCHLFAFCSKLLKSCYYSKKKVTSKIDFRPIYLYEFKLEQAATKTSKKINKAFGQRSTNKRIIHRCFQKFRNRNISLQRKEGFHEINVLENEKIKRMVEHNPRITVRELTGELNVSVGTVSNYLKPINMKKIMDSYIPHEYTLDQCFRSM